MPTLKELACDHNDYFYYFKYFYIYHIASYAFLFELRENFLRNHMHTLKCLSILK